MNFGFGKNMLRNISLPADHDVKPEASGRLIRWAGMITEAIKQIAPTHEPRGPPWHKSIVQYPSTPHNTYSTV